jgi:hypothetical protein
MLHRHDLAVAAAGRAALDAEGGSHRRLADGDRGPLPDVAERLAEPDGGGRLALTERCRSDGGDDDIAGPGMVGQLMDGVELDLGHVVAVGLEEVLSDAHLPGDVAERLEPGLAGDGQVGGKRHGHGPVLRCRGLMSRC